MTQKIFDKFVSWCFLEWLWDLSFEELFVNKDDLKIIPFSKLLKNYGYTKKEIGLILNLREISEIENKYKELEKLALKEKLSDLHLKALSSQNSILELMKISESYKQHEYTI